MLRSAAFTAKSGTLKRGVRRFHRELMANERMAPDQLHALQNRLAGDIVEHAMHSSPFYARVYGGLGIDAGSVTDPEQWAKLPILDRATVKAHDDEFPTPEATGRNVRVALTGGSTGEPLRTMQDARTPSLALSWRMYSWWGVRPYDDLARVARWRFDRLGSLKNSASWWPTRQVYLDARLVTAESMAAFQRTLTRVQPRLIEGYVDALLEFADFLQNHELTVPRPLAVATTAAPLTASARARLEHVFGAPVHDEFRGSEFGWMAGECARRDGLHIFADVCRIEVVDEDGEPAAAGELGDIVITDLRNRVFPLIRYRTGDRGILRSEPCPCGSSLPMMEQVQGRTTDVIRLPSGGAMLQRIRSMFSAHPEAIRKFQVHQASDYSITVRIVEGDAADGRQHIEAAVARFRELIRDEVPVRIEYMGKLPYAGGKLKFVISDVAAPAA